MDRLLLPQRKASHRKSVSPREVVIRNELTMFTTPIGVRRLTKHEPNLTNCKKKLLNHTSQKSIKAERGRSMSEPKIETFGNKSDLKKKLKKSKQSIAMLQKKLRLLMVSKVSGQKAVS